MGASLITSRTSRRRKPSGNYLIDWSSPQAKGLSALWAMPNLRDCVNGLVFTNQGGNALTQSSALCGQTLYHDENGHMLCSSAPPNITTKVTLSAWMRVGASTYTGAAVALSDNTISGYQIGTNNASGGSFVAACEYFQAELYHPAVAALEWAHVVGVFDTTIPSRKLYVNGILIATNTQTFAGSAPAAPTRVVINGRYDGGYGGRTEFSDIRIYNRTLNDAEVWALYDPVTRWSVYKPVVKRSYVDLGGGSGSPYTLTGGIGTYTFTGLTTGTLVGRKLALGVGTLSESGKNANLLKGSRVITANGAFSEVGNITGLRAGRYLSSAVGNYNESGLATGLRVGRYLAGGVGSYIESGNVAGLLYKRIMPAVSRSYTINGITVNLIYTPVGARSMLASTANFTLSAAAAQIVKALRLPAANGSYTLTSLANALTVGRKITTSLGTFTLLGANVVLDTTGETGPVDYSQYLFGQANDSVSVLSIDLHVRDDTSGAILTTSLGG